MSQEIDFEEAVLRMTGLIKYSLSHDKGGEFAESLKRAGYHRHPEQPSKISRKILNGIKQSEQTDREAELALSTGLLLGPDLREEDGYYFLTETARKRLVNTILSLIHPELKVLSPEKIKDIVDDYYLNHLGIIDAFELVYCGAQAQLALDIYLTRMVYL